MSQLEHIEAIEKRLWKAADNLRVNSNYTSNESFLPVMGLVFLRHAYSRYQLDEVDWWVRNVEKKPSSFWLQTASDRFYPDFVVRLTSGVTLAIEYKGSHFAENRDSREKKRIGELWQGVAAAAVVLFG